MTWQLAPGASVPFWQFADVIVKSPLFGPEIATRLITSAKLPVLVTVRVAGEDLVLTTTFPNANVAGPSITAGASPTPLTGIAWGELSPSSAKSTLAVRVPPWSGSKPTATGHE